MFLRYELIHYIYSSFVLELGMPLLRPMFYEFPSYRAFDAFDDDFGFWW